MKHILFILTVGMSLFSSGCVTDNKTAEKTEQSTDTTEEEASVADIVRMPVTAKGPVDTINVAKIKFEEQEYNFGSVYEGDIVRHTYTFRNTGKLPLIITHAQSTCGCTVADKPKEPIPPGKSGEIKVKFDTKGKPGRQHKPITVTANTYPKNTILNMRGKVIRK